MTITLDGTTGITTPGLTNTGTSTFTSVAVSGAVTLSGGTANGVGYLNGSKVLTTGSALTFDGTNLGVGGSASQKFHVQNAGAVIGLLQNTASTADARYRIQNTGGSSDWGVDATGTYFQDNNSRPFFWFTAGSEQMRLTSTGLGIGTSSPGYKLDVNGAVNFANGVYQRIGGVPVFATSGGYTYYYTNTNGILWRNAADTVSLMALDTSGNLGVGTSIPSGKITADSGSTIAGLFRCSSATSYTSLRLYNDQNLSIRSLEIDYSGSTYSGALITGGPSGEQAAIGTTGAYPLVLYTNNTSKVVIDSAGSLGLGVTPSAWFTSTTYRAIDLYSYGCVAGNDNVGGVIVAANAYASATNVYKYKNSYYASMYQQGASAHSWYTAPSGTTGNVITFTQAMTLDASGNLLLGTTSVSSLSGNCFAVGVSNYAVCHATGTSSGTNYAGFLYNGSTIGSITQNGTTGVAYNTSSDYRLKNITGPITNSGAYIDSLKPVEGTWKADGSTFVGLIAHEVQEASRTVVATGTKDGEEMQGMDYSSAEIIANLIAEIQSLRVRLNALESK